MGIKKFIGRKTELKLLNDLLLKKTSSLVVVRGRRRIGKSRLITEFAQKGTFYTFSGLAPVEGITAQHQKNEFASQLNRQTKLPELLGIDDWTKLFNLLADQCKTERVVILFDEISWMSHGDPTFLSKLKNAWDLYFSQNTKLILILCGSVSAWIEKNIISNTGYFGRVSLDLTLGEFSLQECSDLLEALGFHGSSLEKLVILSVIGGIPWYIEQVRPNYSALDNIRLLCFQKNALLLHEYRHIFHDLFGKRSEIYQKITILLSEGDLSYDDIATRLDYAKSSALSEYLNELVISGYITQYHSWSLNTGHLLPKLMKYRLSDNFLRFYFRYMKNKLQAIEAGNYIQVSPASLPGWNSMLGIQFENLVLKNRELVYHSLGINPADVMVSGPYFQSKTAKQKGCQIDYLIQTRYRTLFICEIKFSQHTIGSEVIDSVKEKIARLALPRGFATVPVLIHTSAVSDMVQDADYFIQMINLA